MALQPYISIVLPAYNEAEVINETYRRVDNICKELNQDYEIIIMAPRYFQWVGRGLKGGTSSWSFPALR